jgi:hypothetical protein
MTQRRSRRRSPSVSHSANPVGSAHPEPRSESAPNRPKRASASPTRERRSQTWAKTTEADAALDPNGLSNLIQQDAPLKSNTTLVLMYGPFQTEMVPENGQGVASWLRDCVHKHGIPSLLRFDYRHRAQVFRRDQFQPWLEPLINKAS